MLQKSTLEKVGSECYKYYKGWFVVTDDGICHFFDKDGNLDDIKKVTCLTEDHIRKDIKKIVIPDSVTSIWDCAFYGCTSLTSVMIPDRVTKIGRYAFWGCSGLTHVTIGNGVTSIGYSAFCGCSGLTDVMIPDSVRSIGDFAFYGCSGLTGVIIPAFVMSIGEMVFDRCKKLTNLTFEGKTLEQVKKMNGYPWGIQDESIIRCEVE